MDRAVSNFQSLWPVPRHDNVAPRDHHRRQQRSRKLAAVRIQMEGGRRDAPSALHHAAHAAAGLADVVRGIGKLSSERMVRAVSPPIAGRIAASAGIARSQSVSRSAAEIYSGGAL